MMQLSKEERLLNIDTISNTRDLGGYETQEGKYTKTKCYVRAANPGTLDEIGLEMLYQYGVRVEIDLRGANEISKSPSKLDGYKDIAYYNINLLQNDTMQVVPEEVMRYQDLSGLYIYILEACQPKVKEVFEIFLKYPYDTILFNCSAGKDRTGVIAALLLDLVGCHEYDIVKDYAESYENIYAIMKDLEKLIGEDKKEFLSSKPEYMMKFLAYLREQYGSAKEFLVHCGLTEEQVIEITENFTI